MVVVTVDPESKAAGVLSIPRDLWVDIPGFAPGRINTAHFLGDAYNYPGGGPALAKKTVQRNLGVPIHYYVRVNFSGFRRIVDTLGGITVEVERPIRDDRYPDEHCGYMSIYIPKGVQHMDGETALQYARSRHGSSDFDRARRQQKVLFAIRDQALRLNILPRLPQLLRTTGDTVQTDLQPREILALAQIGVQIQPEEIRTAVIDETMTVAWITPEGADVLIPLRDKMEPLISELFASSSAGG
jgi:LCP family protein required for cell wall assembly